MGLDVREWTCPECHIQHDRDINAAINIKMSEGHTYITGKTHLVF